MVAPPAMQDSLLYRKQASDLSGSMLIQRAVAHFLHRGRFKPHLERMIGRYRDRRDELMRMLSLRMPAYATWTRPTGGFCTWVTVPSHCVPRDLHQIALTHGIAFTPGEAFLVEPDGYSHLRLCFGGLSPELIREAITILGHLMDPSSARTINRLRTGADERPVV
jgi:2-aminoadipate transaminase